MPDYYTQQTAANVYGLSGEDYDLDFDIPNDALDQTDTNAIYTDDNEDYMEYRFQDLNPDDWALSIVTWRTINATATCEAYKVVAGADINSSYTTYLDKAGKNVTMWIVSTPILQSEMSACALARPPPEYLVHFPSISVLRRHR